MTQTIQHPELSTYRVDEDGSVRLVKVEVEREKIETSADPEYIPMDVFVSRTTMREHFRYSSLREQQCGIHKASVR